MKICSICKLEKTLDLFGKKTSSIDGLSFWCKECKRNKDKQNYLINKEKVKENAKNYYKINKTKVLTKRLQNKKHYNEYNKQYKLSNKEDIKEYNRLYKQTYRNRRNKLRNDKRENEPFFRLIENLRIRTNKVLRRYDHKKENHLLDFLGCTQSEFKVHIEKQFDTKMNWDNYGQYWSLDHILPISLGQTENDIYKLNHYTNLRPLENGPNFSKNDKFDNSICWQKQIRDQLLQDDIKKGCPIDTKAKNFILSEEKLTDEHRKFIERYEWLGTIGFGVRYVFTARYNGLLGGVVMIAEPNSYQFTKELEALIQRGACASWTPKNLGSRLIMFACKWMSQNTSKRIFTAYSDSEAGEIGTIYQACGFDYLGQNFGTDKVYILTNGKEVTDRYFTRTSSMKKWAKELGIKWLPEWSKSNGFQDIKNIPKEIYNQLLSYAKLQKNSLKQKNKLKKGKYVLLLNNRKENINKNWKSLPYPKRNIKSKIETLDINKIIDELELDRKNGKLIKDIKIGKEWFEVSKDMPGSLVRILEDGTREIGNFIDGKFVVINKDKELP